MKRIINNLLYSIKKYKFLKIKKQKRKRQMTTAELTAIDGFDRLLQKRGGEFHGKHERMP